MQSQLPGPDADVRELSHTSHHPVTMSAMVNDRVNSRTDLDSARVSSGLSDPTKPGDPKTKTRQLRSAEEIGAYDLIQNPVLNRGMSLTTEQCTCPKP